MLTILTPQVFLAPASTPTGSALHASHATGSVKNIVSHNIFFHELLGSIGAASIWGLLCASQHTWANLDSCTDFRILHWTEKYLVYYGDVEELLEAHVNLVDNTDDVFTEALAQRRVAHIRTCLCAWKHGQPVPQWEQS